VRDVPQGVARRQEIRTKRLAPPPPRERAPYRYCFSRGALLSIYIYIYIYRYVFSPTKSERNASLPHHHVSEAPTGISPLEALFYLSIYLYRYRYVDIFSRRQEIRTKRLAPPPRRERAPYRYFSPRGALISIYIYIYIYI